MKQLSARLILMVAVIWLAIACVKVYVDGWCDIQLAPEMIHRSEK